METSKLVFGNWFSAVYTGSKMDKLLNDSSTIDTNILNKTVSTRGN